MLNTVAFANAIAVVTAVFYIALGVIGFVSPVAFEFLFNAQFLGARVTSLLPQRQSFGTFLGTALTLVITAWVIGFLWAWFYNRFAR
jgi:2TM family of unknown function (DUF5676)